MAFLNLDLHEHKFVSFEDNATKTWSAYKKLLCSVRSFKSGLIHSIDIIDMIGGYPPSGKSVL